MLIDARSRDYYDQSNDVVQAKQVKVYERKVQHAKMKIKTQIKESVDAYISSIRTQQDQLLEELDKLFQEDFHPVKVQLE